MDRNVKNDYLLYKLLPSLLLFVEQTISDSLRGFIPFLCSYHLFTLTEFRTLRKLQNAPFHGFFSLSGGEA
jgi:hypothetical protein